jgi:hypothetical protein
MDNITAAIIGAVGGLSGGLFSGAYQHLRDWLTRPQLLIDYEGKEGANQVTVSDTIYIRARVKNNGRQIARSCRVFWTGLEEVHPSGATTEAPFHDPLVLEWAGWSFVLLDVPAGVSFYVDVLRVLKDQPGWKFSVKYLFTSEEHLVDYRGTYRFHLMVTADNATPASCEIDVTYNGHWQSLRAVPVAAWVGGNRHS